MWAVCRVREKEERWKERGRVVHLAISAVAGKEKNAELNENRSECY